MFHNAREKLKQHGPILICRILEDLDHFMIDSHFLSHLLPIARNPKLRGPHSYVENKRAYGRNSDLGSSAKHYYICEGFIRCNVTPRPTQLPNNKLRFGTEAAQIFFFAGDRGNENRRPIISSCAFLICTVVPSIMLGIKWWPYQHTWVLDNDHWNLTCSGTHTVLSNPS